MDGQTDIVNYRARVQLSLKRAMMNITKLLKILDQVHFQVKCWDLEILKISLWMIFLYLATTRGSNPAGHSPNPFPSPAGQS